MRKIFSMLAAVLFAGSMMAETYTKTAYADLKSGDAVIITMQKGDNVYAASNDQGTSKAPTAVAVTVAENAITTEATNIVWTVEKNGDNISFKAGDDALYCTNTNNGVRVGSGDAKVFSIDSESGYLYNNGTSRYIGVYNEADWRCYTSVNNNISGQTLAFYAVAGEVPPTPAVATPVISGEAEFTESTQVTITCETEGAAIYYTLDGSDPKLEGANVYTAPFNLLETTTVKAVAMVLTDTSAVATKTFTKVVLPVNLGEKTIAEFLTLKNVKDTCILTGVVDSIKNTTYGNLYLSDATGQVYVYGVLNAAGEAKKFAELGVDAGDTLTVLAIYNEYQGAPQVKNAIFVSVKKAQGETPELDAMVFNWSTLNGAQIGTINYGAGTEASKVKILKNYLEVDAIKFNSSYVYTEGKYITIKPKEGSFKAGDELTVEVLISNTDTITKYAMVDVYAADGTTRLFRSDSAKTVNGRMSSAEPIDQTFTLAADQDSLLLGRYGNTAMYVNFLRVIRNNEVSPVLFEGGHAVTWDTPLNLEAAKFAQAKAGQKIVVTYKDATDAIEFKVLDVWCHIAGSREAAYLDQAEGSHTYEQFLTANAVDSIKAHGLQIIGNHFTITKVELLDGKELKDGATIWTGFFWADDWKTLEICHESFNYVDFSQYDALRIYSEANRSDFVINIKENWEEGGQIASQTDMVAGEGYMELPLTDALRTRLANAHHLMFQFNKEAGEPFNVTDIVLVTKISAPTNCAEAAEAALSVSKNNELYNDSAVYTIEGYVTSIATAFNPQYNNVSFWMADTQDGGNVIQAYRAVCTSAEAAPGVGDKVAVTGCLTKYNSTPEFAAGCTYEIIEKSTIVPQNLGEKTIAEFLELKNTIDTCILTGVVDSITNTTYGNLYMSDATAQLYIYGVLTPAGEAKKFDELGVVAGDTLTVLAIYNEYQGAPQAKNAIFVEVKKAPVPVSDTITLAFDSTNTTYAFVNNEYYIDYGTTDLILSDININTTTNQFEGDGKYLVLDFYAEDPNDITGTYTIADETLDIEYTYMLEINGTDTAEVEFVSGEVEIAVGRVNKDYNIAEITVAGLLISTEGDVYAIKAEVVAYYDFLPEEGVENVVVDPKAIKRIECGQIVIEKNGVKYNAAGALIR